MDILYSASLPSLLVSELSLSRLDMARADSGALQLRAYGS